MLIQSRQCSTAFEIGTFNGGTTRLIAEALPSDGHVFTLDLPPAHFDETQHPHGFVGADVGREYRGSPVEGRITQLLGDSLTFDFSPFAQAADVVLVDGAHDYEHGFSDTKAALKIVRPRGLVVWDDFEPFWHGLVNGICDAVNGEGLARLAGTSFAVCIKGD